MPSPSDDRSDAIERAEENITLAWMCLADAFEPGTALMILHQMAALIAADAFAQQTDPQSLH